MQKKENEIIYYHCEKGRTEEPSLFILCEGSGQVIIIGKLTMGGEKNNFLKKSDRMCHCV